MSKTVEIRLPASKSLSNRFLILKAVLNANTNLQNVSLAEDTVYLLDAISASKQKYYLGEGGTTYRFLLAYFTLHAENTILDCADSLQKRPIAPLVDALHRLGAEIEYLNHPGFPPVKIKKPILEWKDIELSMDFSTQYLSALLLISPFFKGPKKICFPSFNHSKAFVQMTLHALDCFGFPNSWNNNEIIIKDQETFPPENIYIENDWTSASYFYAFVAVYQPNFGLELPLTLPSVQGDAICAKLFQSFGVQTQKTQSGIRIYFQEDLVQSNQIIALENAPDLAPALLVADAILGLKNQFAGLENLKFKESDRIAALQQNLRYIGVSLEKKDSCWQNTGKSRIPIALNITTFGDHRIAMAFALLSEKCTVTWDNKNCVQKSFPNFWEQWETCTFALEKNGTK